MEDCYSFYADIKGQADQELAACLELRQRSQLLKLETKKITAQLADVLSRNREIRAICVDAAARSATGRTDQFL